MHHCRMWSTHVLQALLTCTPSCSAGGTDSKHYALLTDKIFRFEPIAISRATNDLARVHGTDERIHSDALILQIKFFLHFIKSCSEAIR